MKKLLIALAMLTIIETSAYARPGGWFLELINNNSATQTHRCERAYYQPTPMYYERPVVYYQSAPVYYYQEPVVVRYQEIKCRQYRNQ